MADVSTSISRAWPSALTLTRSRLSRRNDVTALDIDQHMLRVVHVTTGKMPGSTRIKRVEVVPVPAEGFDLENPKEVGEWIGKQLKALRLVPGTVVMAARRGEAVLKELLLPPLKDAGEMASMVNMRAVRELPFPRRTRSSILRSPRCRPKKISKLPEKRTRSRGRPPTSRPTSL